MVRCFSLILLLFLNHSSLTLADTHISKGNSPARRTLALVTADPECRFGLTSIELRKLFLGLRTSKQQHVIKPLINRQDREIYDLFLQSVMSMSPRTYERRLIIGTFQKGRPRPEQFQNSSYLRQALHQIPCSVTFMWATQVKQLKGLYTIQTLWSGLLTK